MPESARHESGRFTDLESALAILREGKGRVSASRRAILETLVAVASPLSPQQLAEDAGNLDLASTYRSLEALEELGLVRHVHLGHSAGLYELAEPQPREYAVCDECGAAVAFAPERLDAARAEIERVLGYRARFSHFPIVGVCARCLAAGASASETDHGHPHDHDHDHHQ